MGNVETLLQESELGSGAICRRHVVAGRGSVLIRTHRWRRVSNAREQRTVSNARWPTIVAPATIDIDWPSLTHRWCFSPMTVCRRALANRGSARTFGRVLERPWAEWLARRWQTYWLDFVINVFAKKTKTISSRTSYLINKRLRVAKKCHLTQMNGRRNNTKEFLFSWATFFSGRGGGVK